MLNSPINDYNEMAPGGYWNNHLYPGDEINEKEDYWGEQMEE